MRRPALAAAIGLAAVVFAVSVAVPAFGGPSPLSIAKKALRTAKKADKRSQRALRAAKTPGPKGDTGPRGPAGSTGARGPAGTVGPPEAWHEVAAGSATSDACANTASTAVFCSGQVSATVFAPWRNFAPTSPSAAFYRDQLGIVHLKGIVSTQRIFQGSTPTRSSIFRLPAGYRPETPRIFATVGAADHGATVEQEAAGRVDVQADGLVVLEADCGAPVSDCSANGPYLTLDGISFRPDE